MEISHHRKTEEDKSTGSSQDVAASSQNFPTPVLLLQEHFVSRLRNTPWYWVYARFWEKDDQGDIMTDTLYALDIRDNFYLRLPDPKFNLTEFATTVLSYNLYVIAGAENGVLSTYVNVFNPVQHNWSDGKYTTVLKKGAHAASANGCIYLFGSSIEEDPLNWCEVYELIDDKWWTVPPSPVLIKALDEGFSSISASAVLGSKIILQGDKTGITLDLASESWSPVSKKLIQGWLRGIRAAVVQNMLITCYGDMDRPQIAERSIRAYDPDQDVWLQIEGIDNSFHQHAHMSQFLSVNGKLVIYLMWEPDDLRFSVFEITKSLPTTVRADLLCQSRFPITTIINEGLGFPDSKCVYRASLLEAFRADASAASVLLG